MIILNVTGLSSSQNCKIWKLGILGKHEQKINEIKQHPTKPQVLQQRSILGPSLSVHDSWSMDHSYGSYLCTINHLFSQTEFPQFIQEFRRLR